jgi:hypothetical protein
MASCWSGTENKNVWFTFQAISPYVTVTLTERKYIRYPASRSDGPLEQQQGGDTVCGTGVDQGTTVMSLDSLTVGNWYWISVDDNYQSGSFTLCIEDAVSFDYQAGAIEVPHAEWCSADAGYTNIYATDDGAMGSCWSGTINKNVWFKFLATGPEATVSLKTGNIYGSLRTGTDGSMERKR